MKMLKDFPLVFKAFKLIEDDSAGVMARKVERNAVVPDTWVERFKLAEAGLKRVSAKRVRDTRLTDKQLHAFELDTCDGESNRSAFSHVAVPCNTWDKKILKAEKASPQQIKAVSKVLNEFFDGELNDAFIVQQKPKKRRNRI